MDYRDFALELVENGTVSSEQLLIAALKYMSQDEVRDMLDTNELSDRFLDDGFEDGEYDPDGQPTEYEEWQDYYGGDDNMLDYMESY